MLHNCLTAELTRWYLALHRLRFFIFYSNYSFYWFAKHKSFAALLTLFICFCSAQVIMSTERQYDIVLFGATGYTGKLTAEYITTNLPTDIKWAIAGRSAGKLKAVAAECKALNPDRSQPCKSLHFT